MTVPQRQSANPVVRKGLEKLSTQLDTAKSASEATTKEVQHARQTARHVRRDMRLPRHPDGTRPKRTRAERPHTREGKSAAAVELGRKGGAARARKLTQQQR